MGETTEMVQDYRLTTAEILYYPPDDPDSLETFTWRSLDRLPDFPKLNQFLEGWASESDGELHSVRVAYVGVVESDDWCGAEALMCLQ